MKRCDETTVNYIHPSHLHPLSIFETINKMLCFFIIALIYMFWFTNFSFVSKNSLIITFNKSLISGLITIYGILIIS